MPLEDLYQQLLIEHARNPRNRGTVAPAAREVRVMNPVCGDEVTLTLSFDGERIAQARFSGHGCMISQAAASMLTSQLEGKSVAEIRALIEGFRAMMRGADENALLGDLQALEGVKQFPIRIKCALLAFEAADKALSSPE